MSFIKRVSMVSAIAITLATPSLSQDAASADTVLATVNGTTITLGHLVSIASNLPAQYNQMPADQLFEGILDQLVQQTLLEQSFKVNEKSMQIALENERRARASGEALDLITQTAITDEAIQALYDGQIASSEPTPAYQASHILVKAEETAHEIMKMLEGGADFATLAKEKSTGPSGPSGGDLGWFGRGAMVPEFDKAVADMKIGEFVGPVKTQFGYHVIILNDQRDYPTLDSQREELSEQVGTKAIDAEIARLEAAAKIEMVAPTFDLTAIRDASLLD